MKTWESTAVAVSTAALMACGSSSGSPGEICIADAGCAGCADRSACFTCNAAAHQPSVAAYNALVDCVSCSACFSTCDSAVNVGAPGGCTVAPGSVDACDVGAPSMTTCQTCVTCSLGGTCKAEDAACKASADCGALTVALAGCPAQ